MYVYLLYSIILFFPISIELLPKNLAFTSLKCPYDNCTTCNGPSRQSYEIINCTNSYSKIEKCPCGNRCVQGQECVAKCEIVDDSACYIMVNNVEEKVFDGCSICNGRGITRCFGNKKEQYVACDEDEVCIQPMDDLEAKCSRLNIISNDTLNCQDFIFEDYCVETCPENSLLLLDEHNKTCVTPKSCIGLELNGTIDQEFCRLSTRFIPIKNSRTKIVAYILGVFLFLMAGLFVLMILRYCRTHIRIKKYYVLKDLDLPVDKYDNLYDPSSEFSQGITIVSRKHFRILPIKLGEGSFGIVYKGELCFPKDPTKYSVAIKEIKENIFEGSQEDKEHRIHEMLEEAKIMAKIDHPNVLPLYGVCIAEQNVRILTPYRRLGSLWNFLKLNQEKISPKTQLGFCRDIASAMAYLSSKNIIHGDLAARNVLIAGDIAQKGPLDDARLTAQISDFGLAQILNRNPIATLQKVPSNIFPLRWTAIECLESYLSNGNSIELNEKTDVWSLGVTLWEIFTFGKVPYEELFDQKDEETRGHDYSAFSDEINQIVMSIDYGSTIDQILGCMIRKILNFLKIEGSRLEKPEICNGELWNIIMECWFELPSMRPIYTSLEEKFAYAKEHPCDYVLPLKHKSSKKMSSKNLDLDPISSVQLLHYSSMSSKQPLLRSNVETYNVAPQKSSYKTEDYGISTRENHENFDSNV